MPATNNPTGSNLTDTSQNPSIEAVPETKILLLDPLVQGIPLKYQKLFLRAFHGKASPRQAIKAKCADCNGWEDVARRTRECTIRKCALWVYRPHQNIAKRLDE